MIPASTLDATTDQTFTTTSAMAPGGAAHAHMVTLTVAQLAVLKAGGNVDVPSSIAASHMHTYTVGCH
jgi:hypothetical protein